MPFCVGGLMGKKQKLEDMPIDSDGIRILPDRTLFGFEYEKPKIENLDDWLLEYMPGWLYRIPRRIKDFFNSIKWGLQRIFRKHHASDLDLWGLDHKFAEFILPKLIAFRQLDLHGHPMDFSDWDESDESGYGYMGMTKEEYEKAKSEGKFVSGGMDAWFETIDEMIYAFEFFMFHDECGKKEEAFRKKYNLPDPHAETDENMSWHYACKDKKNGMHMTCGPKTPDELEELKEKYEIIGKYKSFYNHDESIKQLERAQKGMELFGKYFWNLWD